MHMRTVILFQRSIFILTLLCIALFPVFSLPFLFFTALLVVLTWTFSILKTGNLDISASKPVIKLGLFTAICFLSFLFSPSHTLTIVYTPYGPIFWLSVLLLLLVTPPLIIKQSQKMQSWPIPLILTGIYIIFFLSRYAPFFLSQNLPIPLGLHFLRSTWDTPLHFLFGIGPERFLEYFTRFRPVSMNTSPIWSKQCTENASLMLHIGSSYGVLGIITYSLFLLQILISWKKPLQKIQAILLILFSLFAPPTSILPMLTIVSCVLSTDTRHLLHFQLKKWARWLLAGSLVIALSLSAWGLFRWQYGVWLVRQAMSEGKKGNGSTMYLLLKKTLQTNPNNPQYHTALSQAGLLLIQGIISNAPLKNNKLIFSNENKTLIQTLATRSIQEAKTAISLSPDDVRTWTNLTSIYHGLIGLVKDSDTWEETSYETIFILDPTNPIHHVSLGNLYMMMGKDMEVKAEFQKALTLKPDYTDAWRGLEAISKP